jgi:DNA polymerase-3 subunit delta
MSPIGKSAILLIHGNHRLLVEEELKKVKEKISGDVDPDFNIDVFEAGEDAIEDVLQAADTLPMASDRRYVIVKEAQKLASGDIKRLKDYANDPSESSILILTAVGLKAGSPLLRLVEEKGRVREVSKRKDQIPGWIRGRFKDRGLKVSGKALAYLQEALGEDLMAIEGAVEKIALFHQGGEEVDLDEVVPLVAPSAERSLYELVDRVALGDSDQAVKLLRRLLQQGERPTHILYSLARRYRQLLLYRALREEGRAEGEVAAYMKLPRNQSWMVAKKLKPQAARLSEDGLRKALSLLVRVDWAIKTGEMDDEFAVEMAVTGLSKLSAKRPASGRSPARPGRRG